MLYAWSITFNLQISDAIFQTRTVGWWQPERKVALVLESTRRQGQDDGGEGADCVRAKKIAITVKVWTPLIVLMLIYYRLLGAP